MLEDLLDGFVNPPLPLLARYPKRGGRDLALALGMLLALVGQLAAEVPGRDSAAAVSGAFGMDHREAHGLAVDATPLPEINDSATAEPPPQELAALINPLTLIGQAPIAGARDAIGFGNLAYVCGDGGISVFDVGNPAQPRLLRTVGNAAGICRIRGNELVTSRPFSGPPPFLTVSSYSLADPQNPQFLGNTPPIRYNFAADFFVTSTHAFAGTLQFIFFVSNNDIFAQTGDVLSFDISNPAAPRLVDVLLDTHGTNNDGIGVVGGIDPSGGNFNIWQFAQPDPQTLLVASTTSTGGDTQVGTGLVRVIDIGDPANLVEVGALPIPGAVQLIGLALEGNRAFVTGSTGGWQDFFNNDNAGLSGNIVLATLDVSVPRNPQLVSTQILGRRSRGVNFVVPLGNARFAFSSLGSAPMSETPQLVLVDAGDPLDLSLGSIAVPAEISHMNAAADRIYTASSAGFLIYGVNALQKVAEASLARTVVTCTRRRCRARLTCNRPLFSGLPCNNRLNLLARVRRGLDRSIGSLDLGAGASARASRRIRIASGVANIPPGQTADVPLRLTSGGRRIVGSGTRRLSGVIRISNTAGNPLSTTQVRIRIR